MAGKHMRQVEGTEAEAGAPSAEQAPMATKATGAKRAAAKPCKSLRRRIANLLILVGIALLLAAGGMWGYAQLRYMKQDKMNKQLAEHVTVTDTAPAQAGEPSVCPVEVDWAALKAVNTDVVGWIYVPGTVVNYPVYQSTDNEYYLRTNALGEWSVGGQVFLDADCTAPGMVDHQSILYGHHLQDGTMFQPLSLLDDQATFDATETIWYVTEERTWELEPLFLYYVEPYDQTVRQFRFVTDEQFRTYLAGQLAKAVTRRADADELVASAQRILTMSTCNYYDGYGRSILVAIEKDPTSVPIVGTATN